MKKLISSICFFLFAYQTKAASYFYNGYFEAKGGLQTSKPNKISSEKLTFDFTQNAKGEKWETKMGFRMWSDSAYLHYKKENEYSSALLKEDLDDISLRDFYAQYQNKYLFLRLGNQQVVWGEAFGFFYSDIVNPKDLRYGGFGELESVRMSTPMTNLKFIGGNASLQFIHLPKPYFNLLPQPGSQYFGKAIEDLGITNLSIRREKSLDINGDNQEAGGRFNFFLAGFDVSMFYFDYFDRMPYYELISHPSATELNLAEKHQRIQSYGMTFSYEYAGFLLRFEGLQHHDRVYSEITGFNLNKFISDENVFVVGLDLPSIKDFLIGLQYSESKILEPLEERELLRKAKEDLISFHLNRAFKDEHSFDFIYSYAPVDSGQRYQVTYLAPLTDTIEAKLGLELFSGPDESMFGLQKSGSQVFVSIKNYFKH